MALQLTSPAFQHGGDIPKKFTCEGDNVSPPLQWTGVPAGTKSFALILEDRDESKEPVRWILYQIPADAQKLPEDIPHGSNLPDGLVQGLNDTHQLGYGGLCPKRGEVHRSYFTLYALNTELGLQPGARKEVLVQAMKDHILASAELMGQYQWTGIQEKTKTGSSSKKGQVAQARGSPSGPEQTSKTRMQELENDPEYLFQLDKVQRGLETAHASDPRTVGQFFRRYGLTSAFAMKKVREFMREIEDETIRRALEDYVKFANRFRVQLRLKTDPRTTQLEFRVVPWLGYGTKFHVRYVPAAGGGGEGEHLEPAEGSVPPTDPYVDHFEDEGLKISESVQELIDEGKARFVQIEDAAGYSILKDLESFAYKEDGVAIIHHNAEQPYLLCIFGEKTPKNLLPRIGKALTEFQKTHFDRGQAGRPPNIEELKKALALDRKKVPKIGLELTESADPKKIKEKEVKVSKLRRKKKDKY